MSSTRTSHKLFCKCGLQISAYSLNIFHSFWKMCRIVVAVRVCVSKKYLSYIVNVWIIHRSKYLALCWDEYKFDTSNFLQSQDLVDTYSWRRVELRFRSAVRHIPVRCFRAWIRRDKFHENFRYFCYVWQLRHVPQHPISLIDSFLISEGRW